MARRRPRPLPYASPVEVRDAATGEHLETRPAYRRDELKHIAPDEKRRGPTPTPPDQTSG